MSRGPIYLTIAGSILLGLGGFALYVTNDPLNFFICMNYHNYWFSSGPPCLFKGDQLQLLNSWTILVSLTTGALLVLYTKYVQAGTTRAYHRLMNCGTTGLILILGSCMLFYLGDIDASSTGPQSLKELSGYRLNSWLESGSNYLLAQDIGATLVGGMTAFLVYGAIFKFNLVVSKLTNSGQYPINIHQIRRVGKRGVLGIFLLSTAIAGPPIYLIFGGPLRVYIDSIDGPNAQSPMHFFYWDYFLAVVFFIDLGRMTALAFATNKLTKSRPKHIQNVTNQ